jgi:hypothetical protein
MVENPRGLLLSPSEHFVINRGVVVDVDFNLQPGFRWLCAQSGQIQHKGQTCEPIPREAHVALRRASRSEGNYGVRQAGRSMQAPWYPTDIWLTS